MSFATDQAKAARTFAHTMIVVDDEPLSSAPDAGPKGEVVSPTRRTKTNKTTTPKAASEASKSHPLDAKGLVKTALESGLVCSVVNPEGSEGEVVANLARVASRADIVSLDWHMNKGDDGELATQLIQSILDHDQTVGGRLRLIGIYTGNPDRASIFKKLRDRLNSKLDVAHQIAESEGALVNSFGLRIVWREKALLAKSTASKLSEKELPEALLEEFSKLSQGLLTNVALGTISAIRDTTHHVLSKFNPSLDGPFFHHRAFLPEPNDSVDYAVSVVLSSLKSEVDSSQIAADFLANAAIERRIRSMDQSPADHKFRSPDKKGVEQEVTLSSREICKIVTKGYKSLSGPAERKKLSVAVHDRMAKLPGKDKIKKHFSNVFFDSSNEARRAMLDFSLLTNSKVHELSVRQKRSRLRLDLGSVLHSSKHGYLLCLQATCDAGRGTGAFFFVPMEVDDHSHDHVVPHSEPADEKRLVCLTVPTSKTYTRSIILNFGEINKRVGGVAIRFDGVNKQYFVKDTAGKKYRWLANLKYKRALRAAQAVSQGMTRIGFDEFEPFRKEF